MEPHAHDDRGNNSGEPRPERGLIPSPGGKRVTPIAPKPRVASVSNDGLPSNAGGSFRNVAGRQPKVDPEKNAGVIFSEAWEGRRSNQPDAASIDSRPLLSKVGAERDVTQDAEDELLVVSVKGPKFSETQKNDISSSRRRLLAKPRPSSDLPRAVEATPTPGLGTVEADTSTPPSATHSKKFPSSRIYPLKPTLEDGISGGDRAGDDEDIIMVSEKIANVTRKDAKKEKGAVGSSSIHESVHLSGVSEQRSGESVTHVDLSEMPSGYATAMTEPFRQDGIAKAQPKSPVPPTKIYPHIAKPEMVPNDLSLVNQVQAGQFPSHDIPLNPQLVPTPRPAPVNGATKQEMEDLEKLSSLYADADQEVETPKELKVKLHPHQKRAVCWMMKREQRDESSTTASDRDCRGGILADDQGLGKTITTIALLYANQPKKKGKWGCLIVCPTSLVNQWMQELKNRVKPGYRKAVHMYHGKDKAKSLSELRLYDIVITTYGTLSREYPKILRDHPRYQWCVENKQPKPTRRKGLLFLMNWRRCVLDESHHCRNPSTENWKAVCELKSSFRWALTGTPVQNSITDLYALLKLCGHNIAESVNGFNRRWKRKLEHPNPEVRERHFKLFRTVISPVMLRRSKNDTIEGKPIVDLPKRTAEIIDKEFQFDEEKSTYLEVLQQSVITFNKVLLTGKLTENMSVILVKLLRLRQAAFHPYLIEHCYYLQKVRKIKRMGGDAEISKEDQDYAELLGVSKNKVMTIGQALNAVDDSEDEGIEDACYSSDDDFIDDRSIDEIQEEAKRVRKKRSREEYASDSGSEVVEVVEERRSRKRRRVVVIDSDDDGDYQDPAGNGEANGQGSNSIMNGKAESVLENSMPNPTEENPIDVTVKMEPHSLATAATMTGSTGRSGMMMKVKQEDAKETSNTQPVLKTENNLASVEIIDLDEIGNSQTKIKIEPSDHSIAGNRSTGSSSAHITTKVEKFEATPQSVDQIQALDIKEPEPNRKPLTKKELSRKIKEAVMKPSTKINALIEKLTETKAQDPDRKSLIFSQWTSCLDIVKYHVEHHGFKCCRLDGGMNIKQRMKEISKFGKPKYSVFLISLKAGGEGLNLIMASQVFLLDAWWNPAVEEQAIDRVHRIGQKQDVMVYRFRITNTIESKVYEVSEKKRQIIAGSVGEVGAQSYTRAKLSFDEIMKLFRGVAQNLIEQGGGDKEAQAAARNILRA